MFKIVAVTVCWIACMAVIVTPAKVDTSVFDSLNIDKIMRNEGALNGYFKCLMEKGQCPPGGIELKSGFTFNIFYKKKKKKGFGSGEITNN